jgi:hypothetical protein
MADPTQLGFFDEPLPEKPKPIPEQPELKRLDHIQPPSAAPNVDGKELGMARALRAENEAKKEKAMELLKIVCQRHPFVHTDLWHQAAHEDGFMFNHKAIGSIWSKAIRRGWIVATKETRKTKRKRANARDCPVYRSCLYQASA